MKKITLLICIFFFAQTSFGQKLFNNNFEDTLSIEKMGRKIELENDLAKSEHLNDLLINEIVKRKNSKKISKKLKTYYENAYLITLLSKAYFDNRKGDYKKEIAVYYQILNNKNSITDFTVLAYTYNAIGISFLEIKDYKKCLFYFKKALIYHKKKQNISGLSTVYDNIGELYLKTNQLDKALIYFKKSEYFCEKNYDKSFLGYTCNNIGIIYFKKKEYQNAIKFYTKGIAIAINTKDNQHLSRLYLNLANVYQKIKNNYLYEKNIEKSFKIAESSKNLLVLKDVGLELFKIYKAKNDYKNALNYYEKSTNAKDTLEKEDNKNAILKADFKHETEKKQNQIKTLFRDKKIAELKSERQTTIVITLLLTMLIIALLSYFIFNKYKINKQNELLKIQLKEAEKTFKAEKKAAQSELKALKSQMNPHFIFNALNGIQEQFMYGDKLVANEQMGNFTYLTRQILELSGRTKIPIATEIDLLTKYLELEKMRFDNDFEYQINLNPDIDEDYIQIPPMLIQPFVENSIKHGLLHKKGAKEVILYFEENEIENYIKCTIIDNGIGREKSNEIKLKNSINHQSFSTNSIDKRLEIWNTKKINPVIYEDLINDNNEVVGTKVTLLIEIH